MSTILVAAEAAWVRELVRSSCTGPGQRVVEVVRGQDVRAAVTAEEPELVILDMQIANQAIDASIKDFEDAIQFFSALRAGAAVLITRNPKDFPVGDVAIQTPAELLAAHFAE